MKRVRNGCETAGGTKGEQIHNVCPRPDAGTVGMENETSPRESNLKEGLGLCTMENLDPRGSIGEITKIKRN